MEMEHIKRAVVRCDGGSEARADDLGDILRFHEMLFEEMGFEMSFMADIMMAMDTKIDRLEEEIGFLRRGHTRFRRLGKPPSL